MKKLTDFLFKDLSWKFLSLFLAALLWLVCINVINPIISKTYSNNLSIKNIDIVESNGYVLLNKTELENQIIVMSVRAVSDSFSLVNNSSFMPYIDVSPIDYLREETLGMNQPLNVYVDRVGPAAISNFSPENIAANPLTVNIRLDKMTEAEKPITVNVTGKPMDFFIALPGRTYPETIKITGPSTVLNRISTVSAEVDVSGASEDVTVKLIPKIMDVDKKDITDMVALSEDYVEVRVPINLHAKIPVRQSRIGNPAEGYEITSIERSMDYVDVMGTLDDINSIDYISLPDLDVSGWTDSGTVSFDVRPQLIDTSLSVVNGTPNEVLVTVNIEKQIKKEVTLSKDDIRIIGLPGGFNVSLTDPGDFSFTVKGLAEKINGFDESMIQDASINVVLAEPGIHSAELSVLLPQGVYQDEPELFVEIEITLAEEEPPEEPGETDPPEPQDGEIGETE